MQIIVDTRHDDAATMRLAASLLLTLSGDIDSPAAVDPQPATGALLDKLLSTPPPPPMPAATSTSTDTSTGSASSVIPPPPPLPNGTPPVPSPPPPSAATTAAPPMTPPSTNVPNAAAAPGVVSAGPLEYDAAGMPWDARIHQKAKGKKKDNTWKLIKGIDTNIVQAVVKELQATKLANAGVPGAAPPDVPAGTTAAVAPPVTLPARTGSMPVPPPPPVATVAQGVPTPPVPAPVPVPTGATPGGVPSTPGAMTFRQLIDKIGELVPPKGNKLSAQKVNEIVQSCGAPNLMALSAMPNLIETVSANIDLALAGLA